MSELRIDPDLGAALDWAVGETYDIPVVGTVTAKTPEGGYTLSVTSVEEVVEEEVVPEMPEKPMMKRKGPSAVNAMIGKM